MMFIELDHISLSRCIKPLAPTLLAALGREVYFLMFANLRFFSWFSFENRKKTFISFQYVL